jgi:phage terminase large subunit
MQIQSKFHPRNYQIPILRALDNGKKRVVWCAHRRCGKDLTILNWCISKLIKEPCTCFYILPTYSQAKKIVWDSLNNDGMRVLDYFPAEFIAQKNIQEMKIRFGNGSLFQLIGSENIDSLMGTNPKIVVFSEYALQNPSAWQYLSPILKVNDGTAIFISTPRGKNHFYDLCNYARTNPDWYYERLTIEDTGVLTKEDVDKEIAEGMSEELAMQEYYVSFDRGVEGSYYGRLIDKMRLENRIGNVMPEPKSVVNTYWDCGYGDSTAIVFAQDVGSEFRIIDYYENHSEGLPHYVKYLQNKPYVYGNHYFPHDAGSGSLQTGHTLQKAAQELGIKAIVLPRDALETGIEMTRNLLSTCYIDETKCNQLIKCLEHYRKRYNESTSAYSNTPVHNWASHGADAMRYCAVARNMYGKSTGGLTPDKIRDMRERSMQGIGVYSTNPAIPQLNPFGCNVNLL